VVCGFIMDGGFVMNSKQRDALFDAIEVFLFSPHFNTELVSGSTMKKKVGTKNLVEHFFVKVTVGIRPLVISDYRRSITTIEDKDGKKTTLIFAEVVIVEKETVTELLGRVADEVGLLHPQYVNEESGEGRLVFKFE
jgi:hypothetical protein